MDTIRRQLGVKRYLVFLAKKKKKFPMMNSTNLTIVVVSYKDKNLFDFVNNLDKNTISDHSIEVFEQHPVDHYKDFWEIPKCSYEHKIWDDIAGLTVKKISKIEPRLDSSTHICIITPDSVLSYGWDKELLEFMNSNDNVVISGGGLISVTHKDLFSLEAKYVPSKHFSKTNFINKNFIFAKSEAFNNIVMPNFLKYYGEDEYWTLAFMSNGYEIFSCPDNIYVDKMYRSIENTYHTFSSEHNYNVVVDILNKIDNDRYGITDEAIDRFANFHKIDTAKILKLPYQTNDVLYDPYDLKMHDVDARRFIAGTKAVY
jgi:hypothetical protein